MPIHETSSQIPPDRRRIEIGEELQQGDYFVVNHFSFYIGGPNTELKPGDKCPAWVYPYWPSRKK